MAKPLYHGTMKTVAIILVALMTACAIPAESTPEQLGSASPSTVGAPLPDNGGTDVCYSGVPHFFYVDGVEHCEYEPVACNTGVQLPGDPYEARQAADPAPEHAAAATLKTEH